MAEDERNQIEKLRNEIRKHDYLGYASMTQFDIVGEVPLQ
jgi:hypothetical protein